MSYAFAKYVGCGNDFILFDNRSLEFPFHLSELIAKLCNRHYGIGADGLILLELSKLADCQFRIFNADGFEVEMCGNGIRCFVKWLKTLGFNQSFFHIETKYGLLQAAVKEDSIQIEMGTPSDIKWNLFVINEKETVKVHHLNTGVPHTLLFVEKIEQFNLKKWGPYIRFHPLWSPKGTNFTAVELTNSTYLKIRTYERGLEKETLACGTAATAAALATSFLYSIDAPLTVQMASKEELVIDFKRQNQSFSQVTMTGKAHAVFQGQVELPTFYLAEVS